MPRNIFVRPVTPEDAGTFLKWVVANEGNEFDPEPVTYPDSFTLCAFDETGPLAFLPVQQPMFVEPQMLESFAPKPGLSPALRAAALKELIQACITIGFMKGTGEMYFLGTNEATNRFAENSKVFERLDWPVYRLRLSDLNKQEELNENTN
jgi:hypothetical protein